MRTDPPSPPSAARAALGLLLLAAGIATWALWPNAGERAVRPRAGAERNAPVRGKAPPDSARDAVAPDSAPAASKGTAVVEGCVQGADGPLWNARVMIYAEGSDVAFDEVGSGVNGHYRLEVAVAAEGERVDVRARPADDSSLESEWARGIDLRPGMRVRQDFGVRAGELLVASLVDAVREVRPITLAVVPWDAWERLRPAGAAELPDWAGLTKAAVQTEATNAVATFKELPPIDVAVVCVERGWTTVDPPRCRPGDTIEVNAKRVEGVLVTVYEAGSEVVVSNAQVTFEREEGPVRIPAVTHAHGSYFAPVPPSPTDEESRSGLRVEAAGYYAAAFPTRVPAGRMLDLHVGLVSQKSPRLRLHVEGAGDLGNLSAVALSQIEPRLPRSMLSLPVVARGEGAVAFAIPRGKWDVWVRGGLFSAASGAFDLPVGSEAELSRSVTLPESGLLQFGTAKETERAKGTYIVEMPAHTWSPDGEGRYRLVPHPTAGKRARLEEFWDARASAFRLPAGSLHLVPIEGMTRGGSRAAKAFTIEAGRTTTLELD